MCGLVGVLGRITSDEVQAFRELLIIDTLRGYHSVGVLAVKRNGDEIVHKSVACPQDFLTTKKVDEAIKDGCVVLMGHNRQATKGAVNAVNAHPFVSPRGAITGAHNGTLRGQYLLPDSKDFEVDSENIYHSIEKIGLKETCKKLNGAYALTWFESESNTMHFLRNSERPLHFCFSKDGKTMFWASEADMLRWILKRNGIPHKEVMVLNPHKHMVMDVPTMWPAAYPEINNDDFMLVEDMPFYVSTTTTTVTSTRGGNSNSGNALAGSNSGGSASNSVMQNAGNNAAKSGTTTSRSNFPKISGIGVDDWVEFEPTNIIHSHVNSASVKVVGVITDHPGRIPVTTWMNAEADRSLLERMEVEGTLFKAQVATITPQTAAASAGAILRSYSIAESLAMDAKDGDENEDIGAFAQGFDGETLTRRKFYELTTCGCAWCDKGGKVGNTIPPYEAHHVLWLSPEDFLCPDCAEDPEVIEYLSQLKAEYNK